MLQIFRIRIERLVPELGIYFGRFLPSDVGV
jgi:hypothetical protein